MRKLFCAVGVSVLLIACSPFNPPDENQNTNDSIPIDSSVLVPTGLNYVYDVDSLPEIKLEFSTTEWNKLLSYFDQNEYNEEYIKGSFTFVKNGKIISLFDIGLRLRGNTSRRRPEGSVGQMHNLTNPDWHHASFSVKFNKYVVGQKMAGLQKINLKWFKDDGMYVRELYCYDLFERFGVWTAPKSSYCRLSIKVKEDNKSANFGVYEMVEPVDEEYLKNRASKFGDTSGFLWKANWGADLVNTNRNNMNIENITLNTTYTPVYDLKNNTEYLDAARNQLVVFITNLNAKTGVDFKMWINQKMDVELFLKTYAVSVVCGSWDDYWKNKNNYYFYIDPAGKFYFIPFDYDNTLGTSYLIKDSGRQDVLNWGDNANILVKKIINFPEYGDLYKSYIRELCSNNNDYFYVDKSMTRIRKWQKMIENYISNDTGEDMQLTDRPAGWGNCSFYRLLDTNNNFFIIKASNIPN